LISAAVSAGSLYYYHSHFASRIVAFDSAKHINSLRQQLIEKKIDKEELDKRIAKLGVFLKSQPDNMVILPKAIVIGNVETIQPE